MAITIQTLQDKLLDIKYDYKSEFNEAMKALKSLDRVFNSHSIHRNSVGLTLFNEFSDLRTQLSLMEKVSQQELISSSTLSGDLSNIIQSTLGPYSPLDTKFLPPTIAKMIDQPFYSYSSLPSAISELVRLEFKSIYSMCEVNISDFVKGLEPYYKAQKTISQFYESPIQQSLKALEPLSRYYAEFNCEVNSVTVDISHGSEKIIHAKYDRENAIDLLSTILLLKKLRYKPSYQIKEGRLKSGKLFDCSDDHDTHYAEYLGEVSICTNNEKEPITLTDGFQELLDEELIDEDELEDARLLSRRAELFFRRNFPRVFYHGLLFLAEASISHALDQPVSSEEYRELEKMMGDSIRKQLPKPAMGGNTRGGDTWEKVPPHQFVKKVSELYALADALLDGYNKNKRNKDWINTLKLSNEFKPFLRICSERIIDEIAGLLPNRLMEYLPKKRKHGITPLAFACELAARELNIRKKDNTYYGVEYLLKIYRENGGTRGKAQNQLKAGKAARKPSPQ